MKAQPQTELEKIESKIAEVTARRETMAKAAREAKQLLAQREKVLGSQLLDSSDYQDSLDFIASERVRIEGLEEAQKQATAQLAQLETDRDTINSDIANKAYEAQVSEAEGKLTAALATLTELSATIYGIELTKPKKYKNDKAERVRQLWLHLREMDFHGKLNDLTPRFPEYSTSFQRVTK